MTFGQHLRNYRKSRGIDQKTLARWLGYSQAYLCDIEKDRRTPSDEFLLKIVQTLEADLTLVFVWAERLPPYLRNLESQEAEEVAGALRNLEISILP